MNASYRHENAEDDRPPSMNPPSSSAGTSSGKDHHHHSSTNSRHHSSRQGDDIRVLQHHDAMPNVVAHTTPPRMEAGNDQKFASSSIPTGEEYTKEREIVNHDMEYRASYGTNEEPKIDEETMAVTPIAVVGVAEGEVPPSSNRATSTVQSEEHLGRQGAKCCGCCCDFRRAVIIINIVIMILEGLVLILVATGSFSLSYFYGTDHDGSPTTEDQYATTEMIFSGVSIVLSSAAIFGAVTFNVILVGLNVVWLVIAFVLGIFFGLKFCYDYCDDYSDSYSYCYCYINFPGVISALAAMCLFAYPHIGFISQVRKGIMSRETYPREEFSCCCV